MISSHVHAVDLVHVSLQSILVGLRPSFLEEHKRVTPLQINPVDCQGFHTPYRPNEQIFNVLHRAAVVQVADEHGSQVGASDHVVVVIVVGVGHTIVIRPTRGLLVMGGEIHGVIVFWLLQ